MDAGNGNGVTKPGPPNPLLSEVQPAPHPGLFSLGKVEHEPGGTDLLLPKDRTLSGPHIHRCEGRGVWLPPTPMTRSSRWGPPSLLLLTTDAASSKPSAAQLMTRARTPSKQTLGAMKANQHPPGQGSGRGWGPATCRPGHT